MPRITIDMVHPELRSKAKSIDKPMQAFSLTKTRILKALCQLLRRRHSPQMNYRQEYIIRPDGSRLRICVYTPHQRRENVLGLLWIHGGGYVIGVPEQDDAYILRFIEASGCVVVAPDYTLAPDKPYPAALDDCYLSLLWLRDHGIEYGMRPDQIFVGGNSAGGGLAAAVSLYARDKSEVAIAFQMLLYPMLDDRATVSSTNNNAPVWNSNDNDGAWRLYLGDSYRSEGVPIYAAPGRTVDYSALPPTLSFVGNIEPFYDETVIFIDNLKKNGIPVQFKVFDGCFHAFDRMCAKTEIAKQAVVFLMENFAHAVENYFAPQNLP